MGYIGTSYPDLVLTEVEYGLDYGIGPGMFITVYGYPRRDLFNYMEVFYQDLRRIDNELFLRQRKNMSHEPGDIPRFHIHGEPITYKEHYNHFHVIYDREVDEKDIEFVLKVLRKRLNFEELPISRIV